jgi:hypothetical protein
MLATRLLEKRLCIQPKHYLLIPNTTPRRQTDRLLVPMLIWVKPILLSYLADLPTVWPHPGGPETPREFMEELQAVHSKYDGLLGQSFGLVLL